MESIIHDALLEIRLRMAHERIILSARVERELKNILVKALTRSFQDGQTFTLKQCIDQSATRRNT